MVPIASSSVKSAAGAVLALSLALTALSAQAQVQRSTINLSFEQPAINNGCQGYVYSARVPGWKTTDQFLTSPTADFDSPNGCVGNNGTNPPGGTQIFEYYSNGVVDNQSGLTLNAADGRQFVELNGQSSARLYQDICLIANETVTFSFSHLGRRSATVADVARFVMGGTALGSGTTIAEVSDSNDGTPGFATPGLSTNIARVQGPSSGGSGRFWGNYSGSFRVPVGSGGVQQFGFEALSAANGSTSQGNFLDNISITLLPIIEFGSAGNFSSLESNASPPGLALTIVGVVPAGGVPVSFSIIGGNAAAGTDYTINGGSATTFSVVVPAGDYGAGTTFTVPVGIVNDALVEGNETFTVRINDNPSRYVASSTAVCGSSGVVNATYTILDDDVSLVIAKDAVPDGAQDFAFTTTGTGLSGFSLDDDADPALPNTRTFTLAAGAYSVTETAVPGWTLTGLACTDPDNGTTTNTGTRTATLDLDGGETVRCTFTNTATSGDLTLTKTNTPVAGPTDQTGDTVTRGGAVSYNVVVTNNGPAPMTNAVLRDPAPTGLSCTTATCSSAVGGATCPTQTGAALLAAMQSAAGAPIPALPAGGAVTIAVSCSVQ
ncbi:prealbumin-like fold domain-containing protein [Luteimonas aquatica]|uniref:prealbumin-like fold domain-containing protein n=1 Tax=Luteimonas aquatica TaxID=450364 RepID=UPI001F5A9BF1|nr:hypothetical protein [Luteimonas aquatica]